MTEVDRVQKRLEDLRTTLGDAALLVSRGKSAFDTDPALPLAFEALCNRVGDLAKKLVDANPDQFSEIIWSQAARNRDFVVHHYHRVDTDALWNTVAISFPELAKLIG